MIDFKHYRLRKQKNKNFRECVYEYLDLLKNNLIEASIIKDKIIVEGNIVQQFMWDKAVQEEVKLNRKVISEYINRIKPVFYQMLFSEQEEDQFNLNQLMNDIERRVNQFSQELEKSITDYLNSIRTPVPPASSTTTHTPQNAGQTFASTSQTQNVDTQTTPSGTTADSQTTNSVVTGDNSNDNMILINPDEESDAEKIRNYSSEPTQIDYKNPYAVDPNTYKPAEKWSFLPAPRYPGQGVLGRIWDGTRRAIIHPIFGPIGRFLRRFRRRWHLDPSRKMHKESVEYINILLMENVNSIKDVIDQWKNDFLQFINDKFVVISQHTNIPYTPRKFKQIDTNTQQANASQTKPTQQTSNQQHVSDVTKPEDLNIHSEPAKKENVDYIDINDLIELHGYVKEQFVANFFLYSMGVNIDQKIFDELVNISVNLSKLLENKPTEKFLKIAKFIHDHSSLVRDQKFDINYDNKKTNEYNKKIITDYLIPVGKFCKLLHKGHFIELKNDPKHIKLKFVLGLLAYYQGDLSKAKTHVEDNISELVDQIVEKIKSQGEGKQIDIYPIQSIALISTISVITHRVYLMRILHKIMKMDFNQVINQELAKHKNNNPISDVSKEERNSGNETENKLDNDNTVKPTHSNLEKEEESTHQPQHVEKEREEEEKAHEQEEKSEGEKLLDEFKSMVKKLMKNNNYSISYETKLDPDNKNELFNMNNMYALYNQLKDKRWDNISNEEAYRILSTIVETKYSNEYNEDVEYKELLKDIIKHFLSVDEHNTNTNDEDYDNSDKSNDMKQELNLDNVNYRNLNLLVEQLKFKLRNHTITKRNIKSSIFCS